MKLFDLGFQLGYYKAYHMEKHNVGIHLWCIPLILLTAMVLIRPLGVLWPLAFIYGAYYIALDRVAGAIAAPFLLAFALISDAMADCSSRVFWAVFAAHVAAWGAQFYGHFHYEGKAPAVFDNLVQPLVLAPYFVLFEVLFMWGLRPELEKKMLREARLKRNSL